MLHSQGQFTKLYTPGKEERRAEVKKEKRVHNVGKIYKPSTQAFSVTLASFYKKKRLGYKKKKKESNSAVLPLATPSIVRRVINFLIFDRSCRLKWDSFLRDLMVIAFLGLSTPDILRSIQCNVCDRYIRLPHALLLLRFSLILLFIYYIHACTLI